MKLLLDCNKLISYLAFVIAVMNPTIPQAQSDPSREVIVMFRNNVISIPPPNTSVPLSEAQIGSSDIEAIFVQNNVEQIAKAFPDFTLSDTLKTSRTGQQVVLPDLSNIMVVTVPDSAGVSNLISDLNGSPEVIFMEPNGLLPPSECPQSNYPNDYLYYWYDQWALNNCGQGGATEGADINAAEAWQITTGDPSVKISFVDHGIDSDHPDFQGRFISGDEAIDASYPYHGTEVVGIVGAKTNNSIGIAGVDWQAEINSQKTCQDRESRANGIQDAINEGADIINMSFGASNSYSRSIHLMIASAHKLDIICVEERAKMLRTILLIYMNAYPSRPQIDMMSKVLHTLVTF